MIDQSLKTLLEQQTRVGLAKYGQTLKKVSRRLTGLVLRRKPLRTAEMRRYGMFDSKLISPQDRLEANAWYRDLRRWKRRSRIVYQPLPSSSNVGHVVQSTTGAYGSIGQGRTLVGYSVLTPVGWLDGSELVGTIERLPWSAKYLLTQARQAPRHGRSSLPSRLLSSGTSFGDLRISVALALACLALRDAVGVR